MLFCFVFWLFLLLKHERVGSAASARMLLDAPAADPATTNEPFPPLLAPLGSLARYRCVYVLLCTCLGRGCRADRLVFI